ncbi:MAG TPA: FAD-dependent oxidoreductase, partial [Candidatus Udaeobacter sp.]|nr:FAD-dependent oxidoreductase [Candidatus Udaeobacter sp.]
MSRIIVVGAGINGVTAAIELKKRRHQVILIDPGPLPHPLAASTDISKAVRAAYGADEDYTELAERSIKLWRKWNEEFGIELYHETGVMFARRREMKPGDFEYESFKTLQQRGHKVERMNSAQLWKRFPAWNPELFRDGVLEWEAGYAESGRAVATLIQRAGSIGVKLRSTSRFANLDERDHRIEGIVLDNGERIAADRILIAAGAWTPYLLPFTKKFLHASGQAVFHLKPPRPDLFAPERFPVFGADITTTGYYGFPLNRDGIVKIANHGSGREMSPESPQRAVTSEEEENLRKFLSWALP